MSKNTLKKEDFYPLADYHPLIFRDHLKIKAQWDGNPKRPPKKGEWYLSGAIIEAYQAPNDLSTPFHIAKLVQVITKEITTVIKEIQGHETNQ